MPALGRSDLSPWTWGEGEKVQVGAVQSHSLKEAHLSLLRQSSVADGDPELRLTAGPRRAEILQRSLCGPENRHQQLPMGPGEQLMGKWKLENPEKRRKERTGEQQKMWRK